MLQKKVSHEKAQIIVLSIVYSRRCLIFRTLFQQYVWHIRLSVCLPPEPAAFSVKTTPQTRNLKVTNPHLAPMSLTLQVIVKRAIFVKFLFIPPSPPFTPGIILVWVGLPKQWHCSPQLNHWQDANILLLAKTLFLAVLLYNVPLLRVHTCCFMQLSWCQFYFCGLRRRSKCMLEQLIHIFISTLPFSHY